METEKAIQFVELAQRTLANYDYIFAARENGKSVFEVTQLLTGLIGIFVWPKEKYFSTRQPITICWPELDTNLRNRAPVELERSNGQPETVPFYKVIWHCRHGLAHGNFEFISNQNGIHKIRISNYGWKKIIKIATLEQVAHDFVHDLNKSAVATYEHIRGNTPIYECSSCSFIWIGKERLPDKCPSNKHPLGTCVWKHVASLNFQSPLPNCP